ncbi:MAG: dTMP kinase [Candidatus Micrarchaeota archaeon]|nr:dTMP kinase [Candidatus Micrarchaeota archaeon]
MLIVFEGIDGSGKNTQVKKLVSFLRRSKIRHRLYKFPSRKAREVFAHLSGKRTVSDEELARAFAKDILRESRKISKEVEGGLVVICDRYLQSTLAYQGVGLGYLRLKKELEGYGAPVPDVVFILDIDPMLGAKRKSLQKKPDRFESDIGFLKKVRENYLRMARENFLACRYVVLKGEKQPQEIFAEVLLQVEPILTKKALFS